MSCKVRDMSLVGLLTRQPEATPSTVWDSESDSLAPQWLRLRASATLVIFLAISAVAKTADMSRCIWFRPTSFCEIHSFPSCCPEPIFFISNSAVSETDCLFFWRYHFQRYCNYTAHIHELSLDCLHRTEALPKSCMNFEFSLQLLWQDMQVMRSGNAATI